MNPWLYVFIFAFAVVAMVLLICLIIGLSVAVAGRRYSDKLQSRHQKKIRALLPGKDCGQCGCENCDGFARAVLFGAVAENACPYTAPEAPAQMIAIVNDMLKQMEDPRPVKDRRGRRIPWEQKF